MAIAGIAVLALNVIDAADRGASGFNIATIAVGARISGGCARRASTVPGLGRQGS